MWQGGEPTLMGLEFFEKAVRLQDKYAAGRRITNSLQTNGTLLDDGWGRFLHERNFLLGLSLDGPAEIHNAYRRDASGAGSFDAVMRGLDVLKRHEVEFNILASVTPAATAKPLDVYRFFREAGVKFIQFLGIVERLPDDAEAKQGLHLAQGLIGGDVVASPKLTPWSVGPVDYGRFLCEIFPTCDGMQIHASMWLGSGGGAQRRGLLVRPLCLPAKSAGEHSAGEHRHRRPARDDGLSGPAKLWPGQDDDPAEILSKLSRPGQLLGRLSQTQIHANPRCQAMAALLKAGRPAAEIMRGKVISRQ